MTEAKPAANIATGRKGLPTWLLAIVPLLLLIGVIAVIVATDAGLGERTTPPIETLVIDRVQFPEPGQIELEVVNDGPDEITIAQVMVDEAYWEFEMSPNQPLDRLDTATIRIPYPWVEGEGHGIALVSSTGVLFETEVPVAMEAPKADGESVLRFALVGIYVGVVPVALGLLWYPFLRHLGRKPMSFILALTVGLLLFLVVDMWGEAQETALDVAGAFSAPLLVPLLALATMGVLLVVGRGFGKRKPDGALSLSYQIATGIGLHNLGEGLAIGTAFAIGEVALGVFLILGFTLHNVTEGIGIAAPIVSESPGWKHFVILALLAGAPAILGTWIGAYFASPLWTTIFLAIGIGAIAQVVVEVSRLIARDQGRADEPVLTWTTLGGGLAGVAVMYVTALLISA